MSTEITEKKDQYRKTVAVLEAAIKNMPAALGEDPFPLTHEFADGLYIRKITIPAGYFVVGKLHPESFVSFIESGDMSILTEDGIKRVSGPCTQISQRDTKRFGYSHTDTVWYTVHANPTNEQDIDKLDKMIHVDDPYVAQFKEIMPEEFEGIPFDAKRFRELTLAVFSHEKHGFWSDFSEEERASYMSGDWESFSRLRGYSDAEIEELREWLTMKEEAESRGINPLAVSRDIIIGYALRNIMQDTRNEIAMTSHIPTLAKTPYENGGAECLVQ